MAYFHEFNTSQELQQSLYCTPQPFIKVASIVVNGVTYNFSQFIESGRYCTWVNPNDSSDYYITSLRNPKPGAAVYTSGWHSSQYPISSVIEYSNLVTPEQYTEPWVSIVNADSTVQYNRYKCDFNGKSFVDLGLPSGTLWATCNIGANVRTGIGNYYAWGETATKQEFTWNNYAFGTQNNITKYLGAEDGLSNLLPADDVANVIMGGDWHIPSSEQWYELFDNTRMVNRWYGCDVEDNVNGIICESMADPSKSIFLPMCSQQGSNDNLTEAYYWGREGQNDSATMTYFDGDGGYCMGGTYRCYGLPVRACIDGNPNYQWPVS